MGEKQNVRAGKRQNTRCGKKEEEKWELDVESGRLDESLSVSAYLSHADDDESLVKLVI